MTTETKPIIDLSEWEECTESGYDNARADERMIIYRCNDERYFRRKPPLVKSLEEKVREAYFSSAERLDYVQFARIIEEHYKK